LEHNDYHHITNGNAQYENMTLNTLQLLK